MASHALIVLMLSLLTSRFAMAGNVDRLTGEFAGREDVLVKKGLAGAKLTAEEEAQYRLLLCQPRAAWKAAESISDRDKRVAFEAAILALVITQRPAEKSNEDLDLEIPAQSIEMKFALDQDEVWADELSDLEIDSTCDFPIVASDVQPQLLQLAREKMQSTLEHEAHPSFYLFALATDLKLHPETRPEDFVLFSKAHSRSPYIARFKLLAANSVEANSPEQPAESDKFVTDGNRAFFSPMAITEIDYVPHRLELPWLLQ